MRRSLPLLAAVIAITGAFLLCERLLTTNVNADQPAPAVQLLPESTNLHYTGKYCGQCHEGVPVAGGNKRLKYGGDLNQLCRCHTRSNRNYIHPVGIRPSREKRARMPADFPLSNGKLSCATCHDIYAQCQKSSLRKSSLRGAPYPRRTDFCFKCHNKQNYRILDVHKQLNRKKQLVAGKCLYCHMQTPDAKRATFKDLKFVSDLGTLCRRCHLVRGNHSGNFNHLIKPSAKGLAKMKRMEKKFDIILPLDAHGKMTCVTCHNPHEKGVIAPQSPAAKGADSKFRHRLPGRMCIECHQK